MNKLEKIVKNANEILKDTNQLMKDVKDTTGIYDVLKITLDLYINNNPVPSIYKPNVIDAFFTDLNNAHNKLKGEYK